MAMGRGHGLGGSGRGRLARRAPCRPLQLADPPKLAGETPRTAQRFAEAADLEKQQRWTDAVELYLRLLDDAGDDLVPADGDTRLSACRPADWSTAGSPPGRSCSPRTGHGSSRGPSGCWSKGEADPRPATARTSRRPVLLLAVGRHGPAPARRPGVRARRIRTRPGSYWRQAGAGRVAAAIWPIPTRRAARRWHGPSKSWPGCWRANGRRRSPSWPRSARPTPTRPATSPAATAISPRSCKRSSRPPRRFACRMRDRHHARADDVRRRRGPQRRLDGGAAAVQPAAAISGDSTCPMRPTNAASRVGIPAHGSGVSTR